MLNPELKKFPIAVCGSVEKRHGIVLAKNDLAKAAGVSTAEAIWQAKKKCPDLIIVAPHFERYEEYSRKTFEIYSRFTDMIEPFGIDECWLDVTGSTRLFGSGEEIAYKIKETVKAELGLMISVGVSFNKIFAKLGSDMKKPDAITCIPFDSFIEKIGALPCSALLGVGRATCERLRKYHITTISELADASPDFLRRQLGVCGIQLHKNANGLDDSPVSHQSFQREIKSVGNSTTRPADLENNSQVWRVFLELAQQVSYRLRKHHLSAGSVQITVKTPDLKHHEFQTSLCYPASTSRQLSQAAFELFLSNFNWQQNVRALGIRAINLLEDKNNQICIFNDFIKIEKLEKLEAVSDSLKRKYGNNIIFPLSLR